MGNNGDGENETSINLKQTPGRLNFWRLVSNAPFSLKNYDEMPHLISM